MRKQEVDPGQRALPLAEDGLCDRTREPRLTDQAQKFSLQHGVPTGVEQQFVEHADTRTPAAAEVGETPPNCLRRAQL